MSERNKHYLYAQGSIPEFENDGDVWDRYYLVLRAAAFCVNNPRSSVVMPETFQTMTYSAQLHDILQELGQLPPDIIAVPDDDYFLDNAIRGNLQILESRLRRDESQIVKPYANTENLRTWVGQLKVDGYDIQIPMSPRIYFEDLRHPQHRGGWTNWVDSQGEGSFATRNNLPYPQSFGGIGLDQVMAARQLAIQASEQETVYAKLMFSAGGFGVARIKTETDLVRFYESAESSGALHLFGHEQPIEIQEEIRDIVTLGSMQFSEGQLTTPGGLSIQIISKSGYNWAGNKFNAGFDLKLTPIALQLGEKLSRAYKNDTGDLLEGGVDLAIVRTEEGVDLKIVEPNIARTVGADPGIALARAFGTLDKPFTIRKVSNPNSDLATIWDALKQSGISFDPQSKKGVFPLLWFEGTDGFLFIVGDDEKDLDKMYDMAVHYKETNGY